MADLIKVDRADVDAFVKTGEVSGTLKSTLRVGSVGQRTLWFDHRRDRDMGFIPEGFASEGYEERSLELYGASIDAELLVKLVKAVLEKKSAGIEAVIVSGSSVQGDLVLGPQLPVTTSLRLAFLDSDLLVVNLRSNNILGSGIQFERDVSFQCVKATNIDLGSSTFRRRLIISNVKADELNGSGAVFADGAEFLNVEIGSMSLPGSRFGGDIGLLAAGVQAETVDLSRTRLVRGELRDSNVTKELSFASAIVDGELSISSSTLGADGKVQIHDDTQASVSLYDASLQSLRLVDVTLPTGMTLVEVRAGGVLMKLTPSAAPDLGKDASESFHCGQAWPRVSFREAKVNGWFEISGTGSLDVDLSNARATYMDVRSTGREDKHRGTPGACLWVTGLSVPNQFWALPFPFEPRRLADLQWRVKLAAFRAQLEKQAGKSRADAWYRAARSEISSGPFDRWIRGYLLAYGTTPVPPLLVAVILVLTLLVASLSWRADALDLPAQSYWTTRSGRPIAHLLFAVRTVTPIGLLDTKTRPGASWRGISFELVAAGAKALGLVLLGGLLVSWAGYL